MGNAFPTHQRHDMYYFVVDGKTRVEHPNMLALQQQREGYIDDGHDVTDIKLLVNNERLAV